MDWSLVLRRNERDRLRLGSSSIYVGKSKKKIKKNCVKIFWHAFALYEAKHNALVLQSSVQIILRNEREKGKEATGLPRSMCVRVFYELDQVILGTSFSEW